MKMFQREIFLDVGVHILVIVVQICKPNSVPSSTRSVNALSAVYLINSALTSPN